MIPDYFLQGSGFVTRLRFKSSDLKVQGCKLNCLGEPENNEKQANAYTCVQGNLDAKNAGNALYKVSMAGYERAGGE